jgi:hypothetical protein
MVVTPEKISPYIVAVLNDRPHHVLTDIVAFRISSTDFYLLAVCHGGGGRGECIVQRRSPSDFWRNLRPNQCLNSSVFTAL